MGIHGIYKEIGSGQRIALSKLALGKFEETGRPFRIAIDVSIWLFQIQAGRGGTNPSLRTFYYRLLRLISLQIHPVFVFDGPNKPPFKRNKRTGPNVASIPEFLAKQLLRAFGFPIHLAPGEAEAECALLQREGVVDAVLSEDVDTLMFGSVITLRNWSSENSGKSPTHVNVYDAAKTKNGPSGLDREGMILVALMSGGDYVPEGIPGCGPKTACEAARAGFGRDLCGLSRKDQPALKKWRERLSHELKTNESKFFKRKHGALSIPEDFPRTDILGYYTHPAVSSLESIATLRGSLKWDQSIDFVALRQFTGDAFDWTKLSGAKKFIRNLAPALLIRELRIRGETDASISGHLEARKEVESKLIASIHGKRTHASTDNCPEVRVAFKAVDLVTIDLDSEEPDDELPEDNESDEEIGNPAGDADEGDLGAQATKKRGPYMYDPTKLEKHWVFESFVKVGVPLMMQDWEEVQRRPKRSASKSTTAKDSNTTQASKSTRARKPAEKSQAAKGGIQKNAMLNYTKVTKPGSHQFSTGKRKSPSPQDDGGRNGLDAHQYRAHTQSTGESMSSERHLLEPIQSLELPSNHSVQSEPTVSATRSVRKTRQQARDLTTEKLQRNRNETRTRSKLDTGVEPELLDLSGSPIPNRSVQAKPHVLPRQRTPPHQQNSDTNIIVLSSSPAVSPAQPPNTISAWLRRSQTASPSKEWHSNAVPSISPRRRPLETISDANLNMLDLTGDSPSPRAATRNMTTTDPAEVFGTFSKSTCAQESPGPEAQELEEKERRREVQSPFRQRHSPSQTSPSHYPARRVSPRAHSPKSKVQKRAIKLRNSLEGSWKYVDVEELDMTFWDAPRASGSKTDKSKRSNAWRLSEVEVLDLTAE